jgi:glycosyltransferase 2 family protein
LKSFLKLLLKLAVTGVCLWYVGQKIDWADTWKLLVGSKKGWLIFAALFFTASKVLSSFRLNHFFRDIAIRLNELTNLKLYWLGMYYNLFLPGGIGGDAYKVILLNKRHEAISAKKITAAVLLDRISGVAGLGILAALCFGALFIQQWIGWGALLLILPGLVLYYYVVKKWFPSFTGSFYPTLWMGIGVQLLQVICVYGIMQSIGIHHFFPGVSVTVPAFFHCGHFPLYHWRIGCPRNCFPVGCSAIRSAAGRSGLYQPVVLPDYCDRFADWVGLGIQDAIWQL